MWIPDIECEPIKEVDRQSLCTKYMYSFKAMGDRR